MICLCEFNLVFNNTSKYVIKENLDNLDIKKCLNDDSNNSITMRREEYTIKEDKLSLNINVNIIYLMEINENEFLKSRNICCYGFLLSKITKILKNRQFIVAKEFCNLLKTYIEDTDYMKNICKIKSICTYNLKMYRKKEIVIPLYSIY